MERRLSVGILIVGVVGAVVWIGAAGRRNPPHRQLDAAVGDLEMAVRESAAGAHARAVTLSQLPRIGWAVATDEATVRDLTTEELSFRPQAGEHIEIAQVERGQGRVRRLIRIPADARPSLNVSAPGFRLVVDGDEVHVVAVVKIEPRDQEKIVSGLLAVAQRLDLSNVSARFAASGIGARLETPGGAIAVNDKRWAGNAAEMQRALHGPAAEGAKLVLTVPGGIAWGHVAGGMLVLVASLVSSILVARRGSRRGPAAVSDTLPLPRSLEVADSDDRVPQSSSVAAARGDEGVPRPRSSAGEPGPSLHLVDPSEAEAFDTDDPTVVGSTAAEATATAASVGEHRVPRAVAVNSESSPDASGMLPPVPGVHLPAPSGRLSLPGVRIPTVDAPLTALGDHLPMPGAEPNKLKPLEMSGPVFTRGTSTTIPSSLFVTSVPSIDRARASALHAADNPWTAEYRKLFSEFVKLRRTCGESTEDLNRDRFVEALQQKRIELVERHGATDVKFRLAFDNGKAAVRFKTIT